MGIATTTLDDMRAGGLRHLTCSADGRHYFDPADVLDWLRQKAEYEGRTNRFDPKGWETACEATAAVNRRKNARRRGKTEAAAA